jgi:hypothetical protein
MFSAADETRARQYDITGPGVKTGNVYAYPVTLFAQSGTNFSNNLALNLYLRFVEPPPPVVQLPVMQISGPTGDIQDNTVTVIPPIQTTLTFDASDGKFTYDSTITENNRCSLGGIVVPPGVYQITVDWYVNAKSGVTPVAADAVRVSPAYRLYPSGGIKRTLTAYTARGVISTVQSSQSWTIRMTDAQSKIWLDYLQTLTLPSPPSGAGAGALSQGKFTLTVTQLRPG